MKCKKCGAVIPDGAEFCKHCGWQAAKSKNSGAGAAIASVAAALATLAALTAIFSAAPRSSSAEDVLHTAQEYLTDKKYEQAAEEFDKLLIIDTLNPEAYIGKAEALTAMGKQAEADKTLADGYNLTASEDIRQLMKNAASAGGTEESTPPAVTTTSATTTAATTTEPVPSEPIQPPAVPEYLSLRSASVKSLFGDYKLDYSGGDIYYLTDADYNITPIYIADDGFNVFMQTGMLPYRIINAGGYNVRYMHGFNSLNQSVYSSDMGMFMDPYIIRYDEKTNSFAVHKSNPSKSKLSYGTNMLLSDDGYMAYYLSKTDSTATVAIEDSSGSIITTASFAAADGAWNDSLWDSLLGFSGDYAFFSDGADTYILDKKGGIRSANMLISGGGSASAYMSYVCNNHLVCKDGYYLLDEGICYGLSSDNVTVDGKTYIFDGVIGKAYGTKMLLRYGYSDGFSMGYTDTVYRLADLSTGKCTKLYSEIQTLDGEIYLAKELDGSAGFIAPDGTQLASYDDATVFAGDYALVLDSGTAFFVNRSMEQVSARFPAEAVSYINENVFMYTLYGDDYIVIYQ